MEDLPREIRYTKVRPKGFSCNYKEWPVDPMSSNAYWNPNEIVRFLLNLRGDGAVMDPYRSSIVLDIQANPSVNVGLLQVDSSAQSFISQSVVSSNGVEVERIVQYDTLAAYLTDIGFSQYVTNGRDIEGLGQGKPFTSDANRFPRASSGITVPVRDQQSGIWNMTYQMGCQNVMPTKNYVVPSLSTLTDYSGATLNNPQGYNSMALSASNVSCSNSYMTETVSPTVAPNSYSGVYSNMRADYTIPMSDPRFPDSNTSVLRSGLTLAPGSVNSNPNPNAYSVIQQNNLTVQASGIGGGSFSCPNTAPYLGYQIAVSPFTSTGCFEPVISNSVPTCGMQNGNIVQTKMIPAAKRFIFPLLSSICGALIPPPAYQLIPLESLSNLLLQLTLSPFAMFSSGYPDRNQWDVNGMAVPIPRSFRILRMQWVLQIYTFSQDSIRRYLSESLIRGITITNETWSLGAQYQLPNGNYVRAAWPVNSTAQSLAQIVVLFLTNDHQVYPFCRKQHRLSNNITSMQIKYNAEFYPPQPIVGNAGNPEILDATLDNSQYYLLLLKSNNYLFSVNSNLNRINRVNFAINNRIYDPSAQGTMLPLALNNTMGVNLAWGTTNASINADTAMGMPFFHENRYRGCAAFVYSFQPFAHSKEFMNGIDSRQARPFEVIFGTSPTGAFPRDETMYMFLRQNIITVYTKGGVQVIGK